MHTIIFGNTYFVDEKHKQRTYCLFLKKRTLNNPLPKAALFYLVGYDEELFKYFVKHLYDFENDKIIESNLRLTDLSPVKKDILFFAVDIYINNYLREKEAMDSIFCQFPKTDIDALLVTTQMLNLRFGKTQ